MLKIYGWACSTSGLVLRVPGGSALSFSTKLCLVLFAESITNMANAWYTSVALVAHLNLRTPQELHPLSQPPYPKFFDGDDGALQTVRFWGLGLDGARSRGDVGNFRQPRVARSKRRIRTPSSDERYLAGCVRFSSSSEGGILYLGSKLRRAQHSYAYYISFLFRS